MAAATKSAPTLSQQISARSAAAREQAGKEWRALAQAAAGGDNPALDVVLDLARALGIGQADAADEFEADVEALKAYPIHLRTADELAATARDLLAPYEGDDTKLAAAIAAAEVAIGELRRLEVSVGYTVIGAGEARVRARRLAEKHPRVLTWEAAR
jgi:hypothetical protein